MAKPLYPIGVLVLLVLLLVWRPGFQSSSSPLQVTRDDSTVLTDRFTNPYWPDRTSPKLTTPQWIGDEGVEAAAVLSIDDMREVDPYAQYLEPILQRLEEAYGAAPLSIFTNTIDPNAPGLQRFLERGVSIEVHTIDHPCPLLQKSDFAQARQTVHQCIDLLDEIPNMRPVTYRMPCCDSMNSVSPRFYDDILTPLTPVGNFLPSCSSVFQIFTNADPELPATLFANGNENRFERYVPLGKDFVNTIENYPYPYLIGKRHWQFPCTVPSDWEAQYLQGVNHTQTVTDLKAALDATVAKQGLYVFVFHPHGWIENHQVAELIDHASRTHGDKLKFLSFRDVQERLDTYLLDGQPIRRSDGTLSGTQVRDLNADGYMDVLFADGRAKLWQSSTQTWTDTAEVTLVDAPPLLDLDGDGVSDEPDTSALRFWDLDADGDLDAVYSDAERFAFYLRQDDSWTRGRKGPHDGTSTGPPPFVNPDGSNHGVWMDATSFIIQNEDTATEPNVIRRVPFAPLLEEEDGLLGAEALEPEAALRTMRTHPDLDVQLAVCEPLIMDPIDIAWGADGRLWVVEMGDYPLGTDGQGAPGGRVRYLEDQDADGHYESSTLFVENLSYPTGVLPWREGALILAAPDLLYARDTTGDGQADTQEVLYTGFGQGNQQHLVNGLQWGLDNWIYIANGDSGGTVRSLKTNESVRLGHHDLRIRPDKGLLALTSGQTQFGRNRNDAGDWFGCNNSNPIWHYVLDHADLVRNPRFSPPKVSVHLPEVPGNAPIFPTSITHERFNDFHTANCITSACGTMIYRARLLGSTYESNAFIAEPVHNLVHRQVLEANGVTFRGKRAPSEQTSEFLSSTDTWFRPVAMRTAPDGSLWVVDMYRHVIEHPEWIPHDWESRLDVRAGHDRGRLYRVAPTGHAPEAMPDLTTLDSPALAAMLGHDSGTVRDLAQSQFLERQPHDAKAALLAHANAQDWKHRLHVLATLDGLGLAERELITRALADDHPAVRRQATRMTTSLGGSWRFPEETNLSVLLARAIAMGNLPEQGAALAALGIAHEDPYVRAACVSSMTTDQAAFLEHLRDATYDEDDAQWLGWILSTEASPAILSRLAEIESPTVWALELAQIALPAEREILEPLLVKAESAYQDAQAETALRVAALETVCAAGGIIRSHDTLTQWCQPKIPLDLQMAAVRMLGRHFESDIDDWLLSTWPSIEPRLRQEIGQWLSTRPALARRLVTKLEETPQLGLIRLLRRHPDTQVRDKAKALSAADTASSQALEALTHEVLETQGQRERGRTLFVNRCQLCHELEGQGNPVGPDLTSLTNPSKPFLLEAILHPNAAVEDKYLAYTAATSQGAFIGLLEGESGGAVQLRLANGHLQKVLRQDLRDLTSTGRSLMPEGLVEDLEPGAIADLLAFVQAARPPRKSFEFNEPAEIHPHPTGRLDLPGTAASLHGPSISFERRYLNIGQWTHVQDRAIWTYHCSEPGTYTILIDYACADSSSGNTLIVETQDQQARFEVSGTGNWNGFRETTIGEITLSAGRHELVARPAGTIRNFLIDLRSITLKPRENPH